MFDDSNVGLVREPFVGGADTIIDVATAHIPNAKQDSSPSSRRGYFPDAQIVLEWVREEHGGNVYRWGRKKWKAGCVRLCCGILIFRRRSCTFKSRRQRDAEEHSQNRQEGVPKTAVKGKRYRCAYVPQTKPEASKDSPPWYCPNCLNERAASTP